MSARVPTREQAELLADLASADAEVRRLAVERLTLLPLDEALPRLVDCLGDPSWRVRKSAVERLADCPLESGSVELLICSLADGDNPGRRNAAVEALVRFGPSAVPQLGRAAGDSDADVRKFAIDALAGIAAPLSLPIVVAALADSDANVRAAAADALAAVGGEGAAAPLREAALRDSEDSLVRFSAVRGLGSLQLRLPARELAPLLGDAVLRAPALRLLGAEDDAEAFPILLKALGSGQRAAREEAVRSILRMLSDADAEAAQGLAEQLREAARATPELVEEGLEQLGAGALGTQIHWLQLLGLIGSEAVVLPMLRAARDEALSEVALGSLAALGELAERVIEAGWSRLEPESRRAACLLLARTRGEPGSRRLLDALEDADPEVRSAAATAVAARGLGSGLPRLVRALEAVADSEDPDRELEVAAIVAALARLAASGTSELGRRTVELLASTLERTGEGMRCAVARVLGSVGQPEDVETVTFLLKDPSPAVRRRAVEALAQIEPGSAPEPLRLALADESPLVRMAAAAALGSSARAEAFEGLCSLARDEDPLVRAAAVRAVATHFTDAADPKRRAAAEALCSAALQDEVPAALAALESLRSAGPVSRLLPVLSRPEPELLQEAIRCLAAIGRGAELDALLPFVGHPEWSVRAEAIRALGERGRVSALPAILEGLDQEQDEFVREVRLAALKRLEA